MKSEKDSYAEIRKKALEFAGRLAFLYFEKRDLMKLPGYMQPNISWIGTGEEELCCNFAQAQAALDNEMKDYGGTFTIEESWFEAVPLSDSICIVYGHLKAFPSDRQLSEERLRLSLVLEMTENGLKLVHLHFSHGDQAQESGHYYVSQNARTETQTLRSVLNTKEQQIDNLTKNIPGGVHQCLADSELTLVSMSDGFLEMFGYSREEIETLFQNRFLNMIFSGDRKRVQADMKEQLRRGSDMALEYRVMQKNGPPMWVLDKGRILDDGTGTLCFYCLLVEITDRKQQEEELRLSLESHKIIMDQATDIIFEWDILKDILNFSPNWRKRFGYEAIREDISSRIPLSENIYKDDMPAFVKIMKDTAAGVPYSETEFRIKNMEGIYQWCRIRATTLYDGDGEPIRAVGVIVDIDQEKRQKEMLIEQVRHDAQTGLYNKAAINEMVKRKMNQTRSCGFQALMIIDVDHFKNVNDTYGHLCGDRILLQVASVLKELSSTEDLVGRVGGDEFLVYLPVVENGQAVEEKARRFLDEINRISPVPGAPPITCSIGVSLRPGGSNDYYGMYQCADQALYQSKDRGRAGISIYKEGETE